MVSLSWIVAESNINQNKHCNLLFGTYVKVTNHNNSLVSQTMVAIALQPTGNEEDSHILDLHTVEITGQYYPSQTK